MIISSFARLRAHACALSLLAAVLAGVLMPMPAQAAPQLPDFTYQGRLTQNGAPANGDFDLEFQLFDAPQDGQQVGSTVTESDFPVSDGLFTVALAFPGAFEGTQLWLQVTVNNVALEPRQAVATTPVAQFALSAVIGGAAGGALTGTYPNPQIAPESITSSQLATNSVGATEVQDNSIDGGEIVDHSLGAIEIASGAIGTTELASSAVTTAKLASHSVTLSKTAGGFADGNVSFSVAGNDCADFNVSVGSAEAGDLPVFTWASGASVSSNLMVIAMRTLAGIVVVRACNIGNTTATVSNQAVNIRTFR